MYSTHFSSRSKIFIISERLGSITEDSLFLRIILSRTIVVSRALPYNKNCDDHLHDCFTSGGLGGWGLLAIRWKGLQLNNLSFPSSISGLVSLPVTSSNFFESITVLLYKLFRFFPPVSSTPVFESKFYICDPNH